MKPAVCFNFRLYVTGHSPNSVLAKSNLSSLCRMHLPGQYRIEVVDLQREPNRGLVDGIYMTPCLLKLAPSPVRMIVGTLSRSASVLEGLGIAVPDEYAGNGTEVVEPAA